MHFFSGPANVVTTVVHKQTDKYRKCQNTSDPVIMHKTRQHLAMAGGHAANQKKKRN